MTEPRKYLTELTSAKILKQLEKVSKLDLKNDSELLRLIQETRKQQDAILKLKEIDPEDLNKVITI